MKKQIRVERVNQYGHKHFIEGKMPIVLAELRAEAREKRLSSRKLKNLPISVMSIPKNAHQSELVRIASFEISKMPIDGILRLLNKHGIEKYNIV